VSYTAELCAKSAAQKKKNRSVGEPAEGSLTSREDRPGKGVIFHLATLVYLNLLLWWARREAAGEPEFPGPCPPKS
jgi:hypothetical protein